MSRIRGQGPCPAPPRRWPLWRTVPAGAWRPVCVVAVIKNVMRAATVAALAFAPLATPAAVSTETGTGRAAIDCPSGYVCIYSEINFGGQPWVRRAADA